MTATQRIEALTDLNEEREALAAMARTDPSFLRRIGVSDAAVESAKVRLAGIDGEIKALVR